MFNLQQRGDKAHFKFKINFKLNDKGTIIVFFESNTPVEVYLSTDKTKPDKYSCQKRLTQTGKFVP